ncbi:MAG TPA: hypothetical protein VK995_03150 [Oceanipulchritudo sp.]|nr:hypothetical protein [Oceanipulchritudo sp.]
MTSAGSWESIIIEGSVLVLAALSLFLSWWSARVGSPVLAIMGRWVRWIFISTLIGGALHFLGWTGYSFPVLFLVAALTWFMIETVYNWLAISALSKSDLPLFPKFEENERGDEWPTNHTFIKLKDWLRKSGFQKKQALISNLDDQVLMRLSVYENEDQTIRLQLLLLPNARGNTAACCTYFSVTKAGNVIVTDNIFLPFGGFYPENWSVERSPWNRSAARLFKRHQERIDAFNESLMPFVLTPLEQINEDQQEVEQLNRDLGFLNPRSEEAELGRLTPAGRARIWQEVWTLSYLGLPLRY